MRDCLELIGSIIAVHPIQLGEVTFPMPFNVLAPSVSADSIMLGGSTLSLESLKETRCIAMEDYLLNNVRTDCVIAEPGISVKESSKLVSAGTYYTTKITCATYDPIEDVRQMVYDYTAMDAFDVFLVDSENRVFLLRGVEPASRMEVTASLPVSNTSSIEIQMVSVNGLQRVVF